MKTFIIPEHVAPWLPPLISLPPRFSCESSLRTHWTMNSFWKLKPLIDDDGGISPAGLIHSGIRVRAEKTGYHWRADYHPGMFIKSYDSFRQFLFILPGKSFHSLVDRIPLRHWPPSRSSLLAYIYIIDLSFISFRASSRHYSRVIRIILYRWKYYVKSIPVETISLPLNWNRPYKITRIYLYW